MPDRKAYVSFPIRIAGWLMRLGDWLHQQSLSFAWRFGTNTEAIRFMNAYLKPFGKELVRVDDLMKYPRQALRPTQAAGRIKN